MTLCVIRSLLLFIVAWSALCALELEDVRNAQRLPSELEKQVTAEIEKMRVSKKPSISAGELSNGSLENAAVLLSPEGVGYYLAHPDRGSNYGNDRLVFGLMTLGVYMRETLGDHADHRLRIHDISLMIGGKIPFHINHQMGLDVDLALYATDLAGTAISTIWTSYGEDGTSEKGDRLFDVARNWVMVEGMVKNKYFGDIRAIYISDPLKKKLLAHAHEKLRKITVEDKKDEIDALQVIIKEAEILLKEPKSSPHDNHFHLSLSAK